MKYLIWLCLSFASIGVSASDVRELRLGTGEHSGVYHQFGEDLIKHLGNNPNIPIKVRNIETSGSLDNLNRLNSKDLDAAIVQNDICHYVYNGKHGHKVNQSFLAGMPLFTEYLQIVTRRDSGIHLLGDLARKRLSIGAKESGSYWNAIDLLSALGLRNGLDYEASYRNASDSIDAVLSGDADVAIYTRASVPPQFLLHEKELTILPVPPELIHALAANKPYYYADKFEWQSSQGAETISTLSVTAYLVVGEAVQDSDAEVLVKSLLSALGALKNSAAPYSLVDLKSSVHRTPVAYNPGAEKALADAGLMSRSIPNYFYILLLISLLLVVHMSKKHCESYDRLGMIGVGESGVMHSISKVITGIGAYLYIIIMFILIVSVVVMLIQHFDRAFALDRNIDSPFSEISFTDALIWMLLFMSSGHSEGIFPVSDAGKVLAGFLPLLGFMTVLGYLYTVYEKRRIRLLNLMRGTMVKRVKDHVLICGWNDLVPGVIYGLTSKDAPRRRQVVVIAELDDDMPLNEYAFDPKYVSYCRGDSVEAEVLEKAQAANASEAIVVAGVKKKSGKNIRSILSVLSLRKRFCGVNTMEAKKERKELFIAAELVHDENRDLFMSCGANIVVQSEVFMNRLLVCCCISDYIADCIVDIMTHDQHSEIYATESDVLEGLDRIDSLLCLELSSMLPTQISGFMRVLMDRQIKLEGERAGDVRRHLLSNGTNLIGIIKGEATQNELIDQTFEDDTAYNLLLTEQDEEYPLTEGDSLLFLSDNYRHFQAGVMTYPGVESVSQPNLTGLDWRLNDISGRRVLLVGDIGRAKIIRPMMEKLGMEVSCLTDLGSSTSTQEAWVKYGNPMSINIWSEVAPWNYDDVVILHRTDLTAGTGMAHDHGDLDANGIMIARIIRHVLESGGVQRGRKTRIISEMINYRSRHLFEDAEVDVSIPRMILVERLLTKLVFHHGKVCNFIAAMLAVEDGVFLRSVEITLEHQFNGEKLRDVFAASSTNARVWAYLPIDGRDKLKTCQQDFIYHFITCPEGADADRRVQIGDVFILGWKAVKNTVH